MGEYIYNEWEAEQWEESWSIDVGKAYSCSVCGTVIMVTKGGVGVLDPICCDENMKALARDTVR